MRDAGIGRVLVAALHQGIADELPDRLEFYENWFNPSGLRDGNIGLAPLAAVLSFLRRERNAYERVTRRAGDYAADWAVAEMSGVSRRVVHLLPRRLRRVVVLRLLRRFVKSTYAGSRAVVSQRRGTGLIDIRSSVFCGSREKWTHPLCQFYAAAFVRLLDHFGVPATVEVTSCYGAGDRACLFTIQMTSVP
jgi:bacteriochlorophyll 4-vinyl reductase